MYVLLPLAPLGLRCFCAAGMGQCALSARTRTKTLHEPAQSKCISTCHKRQQKSHFIRPDWVQNADEHFVRACAVGCMSTCHKRNQKSHSIQKFTGKMPLPRMSLERNHIFCASLRSRNACQNFTRATLY